MKNVKLLAAIVTFGFIAALFSGCVPQQKYDAQLDNNRQQAVKIDELSGKLINQAAIGNREEFVTFCIEQLYQICNQ